MFVAGQVRLVSTTSGVSDERCRIMIVVHPAAGVSERTGRPRFEHVMDVFGAQSATSSLGKAGGRPYLDTSHRSVAPQVCVQSHHDGMMSYWREHRRDQGQNSLSVVPRGGWQAILTMPTARFSLRALTWAPLKRHTHPPRDSQKGLDGVTEVGLPQLVISHQTSAWSADGVMYLYLPSR